MMKNDEVWKNFLRKHWKATLLMIGVGIVAAIVGISTFLWVVADAQASGLVPTVLGEWTVGNCVTFILYVILWELIFVGSWGIPVVLVIFQWYKKLPYKERKEYERKHKKKWPLQGGSNGFELFVFLTWLIIVWVGGRWNLAFQSWTFNDWVYSGLAAVLLDLLIVGVLGGIFVIWSLTRPKKKRRK